VGGEGKFVQWVDHNENPAIHWHFKTNSHFHSSPFARIVKKKRLTIDSKRVIILICNGKCLTIEIIHEADVPIPTKTMCGAIH